MMLMFRKHTALLSITYKYMYCVYHTAAGNVPAKALNHKSYLKHSRMLEVARKDLSRPVQEARLFLFPVK